MFLVFLCVIILKDAMYASSFPSTAVCHLLNFYCAERGWQGKTTHVL